MEIVSQAQSSCTVGAFNMDPQVKDQRLDAPYLEPENNLPLALCSGFHRFKKKTDKLIITELACGQHNTSHREETMKVD